MEKKISLKLSRLEIILGGRPKKSVRTVNGWTDWMIDMGDIRDIVIEIDNRMADELFKSLTTGYKMMSYVAISENEEYLLLSKNIKIVRRTKPGLRRKKYQTVSIFVKNLKNEWPPPPFTFTLRDLSRIMSALITLDKPEEHCVKDSLRNYQYLLSMLWMKKTDEKLLKGQRKLSAENIFRLGIP